MYGGRHLEVVKTLVDEFNFLKQKDCKKSNLEELANQILKNVMNNYSLHCNEFLSRHKKMTDFELRKWCAINTIFYKKEEIKLLDCAFGGGRDILYAKQCGYDTYGCELNIDFYSKFLNENKLFDKSKIVNADVRCLPFEDNMFDVVRHNASFLHMPMIGPSYTVHKCLEESSRVLKPNGILYIMTKEGEGFSCEDTGDNLGIRPFQYFNTKTITQLINECGFKIININHISKERNNKMISWIEVFALNEK